MHAIQLAPQQGGRRGAVRRMGKAASHLALQQGGQHHQPPAVVEGHAGRAVRPAPAAAVAGHVVARSAVRPHPRAEAGAVQLQEAHLLRVGAGSGAGAGAGRLGLRLGLGSRVGGEAREAHACEQRVSRALHRAAVELLLHLLLLLR